MNNITLLAEDVPGANLREGISLFDHSMQELERWLECRGLKKTGKKTDLVERIKNCIDAGREHYIFLGVDGGLWYDKKREITIQASSSSASSSITSRSDGKWNKFPSVDIPKYFNKGHIYTYIVGALFEDEECEIQYVPFRRGSQYIDSDHVHDVMDKLEGNIYKLRAFCFASLQKHQRYLVEIEINNMSGAVISGQCECKASALGVAAMLVQFYFSGEILQGQGTFIYSLNEQIERMGSLYERQRS
ncbi:hypothetical protein JTB14_019413 [Gonioctena quinquepunctata]|nr:hypothetical protein JTB14_019413 [Gonioctena quinquepunctata]